ncbi:unnamed protein product [Lepeophtheirus salmonis]|uniref:(salmon louse) hypothetical protein n=1 Tax=Lepeophtheirus salmonis TaxID=72036 RepID=A0A7R8CKE1_LEPSM|nr:unnamed protein product [Lepeophtheirus salmonis]CAF2848527.1 unnamed protein product [Lepeophtheirus salmonis]
MSRLKEGLVDAGLLIFSEKVPYILDVKVHRTFLQIYIVLGGIQTISRIRLISFRRPMLTSIVVNVAGPLACTLGPAFFFEAPNFFLEYQLLSFFEIPKAIYLFLLKTKKNE